MKHLSEEIDSFGLPKTIEEQTGKFAEEVELDVTALSKEIEGAGLTPDVQKVVVRFDIDYRVTKYGIIDIKPSALDQTIQVAMSNPEDQQTTIDVEMKNIKCVIQKNMSESEVDYVSMVPSVLEMDLKRKEYTLIFKI
jgi:hypothetical protein